MKQMVLTTEMHESIGKWHAETLKLLAEKMGPDPTHWSEVDKLCVSGTKASSKYCDAIMQLVHCDNEWPAKALMRCLGELNVKFTWSLVGCRDNDNTSEKITKRIHRWHKKACSDGIKLLEESDSIIQPEDKDQHRETLNTLRKQDKSLSVKNMPDLKNIFEQLGDCYRDKTRPLFYSKFNSAVHLDPSSLAMICGNHAEGQNALATYCVANAFNINYLARRRYGFDTRQMEREYDQLMDRY